MTTMFLKQRTQFSPLLACVGPFPPETLLPWLQGPEAFPVFLLLFCLIFFFFPSSSFSAEPLNAYILSFPFSRCIPFLPSTSISSNNQAQAFTCLLKISSWKRGMFLKKFCPVSLSSCPHIQSFSYYFSQYSVF